MFNPVIIIAIIIQAVVAKFSRIAGAVVGYLITTGILLWGLSVYGEGNYIALFGIELSEPVFIIACLVWYGFDTRDFLAARKGTVDVNQSAGLSSTGASKTKIPAIAVWFLWLMTNALANIGWNMVYQLINPKFEESLFTIADLITAISCGMIAGILQWLLLILVIPNANRRLLALWIPATMLGWTIGSVINALVKVPDALSILVSIISGLTIGVLQWLILRKYSQIAFWWIPACVVDGLAIWLLIQSKILDNVPDINLINFLFGAVGAIASSIAIVFILKKALSVSNPEIVEVTEPF